MVCWQKFKVTRLCNLAEEKIGKRRTIENAISQRQFHYYKKDLQRKYLYSGLWTRIVPHRWNLKNKKNSFVHNFSS